MPGVGSRTCGPCGGYPGTGDLGRRGGGCWGSGRTTECSGSHKGPSTLPRGTRRTSHSSLREDQESGARGGLGAQLGGLGGDEGPLGKSQGWGFTGAGWVRPTALGPSVLAGAELAVGPDALPWLVPGVVLQAGALLGPHTPALTVQHLAGRAPAA